MELAIPSWLPVISFLISGLLAAAAQRSYFEDVARRTGNVRQDQAVAADILAEPGELPRKVSMEVSHRLRALITRQASQDLERRRLTACVAIGVSVTCFIWVLTTPG